MTLSTTANTTPISGTQITGREPYLSTSYGQQGQRRLNIMGLSCCPPARFRFPC